ncbi:hypothetical protein BVY04_03475 [bacterium M21]|nr:hypothetical protein BVY04_03475 [bacterium M21]
MLLCLATTSQAKTELVTVPKRENVQLTIYNAADLTLVRDKRTLTLKKGTNRLEFSWANTLIDPTSLEMKPITHQKEVDIAVLTYPPRMKNLGIWEINSKFAGEVEFEITYFTSGISWRAFYMGTLTQDEKQMHLQGYVRVTNNSGEDYANAQVRLVVGEVRLEDRIEYLANRKAPYDDPITEAYEADVLERADIAYEGAEEEEDFFADDDDDDAFGGEDGESALDDESLDFKEIIKEGLSEYFLYTIDGRETIQNGWSKRLPSLDVNEIPIEKFITYFSESDDFDYTIGNLRFHNDEEHKLGETPLPEGTARIYRQTNASGNLTYVGYSELEYIPVNQEVSLGFDEIIISVNRKLMSLTYSNYEFDKKGNIATWDEQKVITFKLKNRERTAATYEVTEDFQYPNWDLKNSGDFGNYEKLDVRNARYTVTVPPNETKEFTATVTIHRSIHDPNPSENEGGEEEDFFADDDDDDAFGDDGDDVFDDDDDDLEEEAQPREDDASNHQNKMKRIIITKISFEETPVRTVFEYLKNRSRVLDPEQVGINFVTFLSPERGTTNREPTVTMDFDNIPLATAVHYICEQAELQYRADGDNIVVGTSLPPKQRQDQSTAVFDKLIVPKVSFEETPIKTVCEYLVNRSKVIDPNEHGVQIRLPKGVRCFVTFDLDNCPLSDIVRYCAHQARLRVRFVGNEAILEK